MYRKIRRSAPSGALALLLAATAATAQDNDVLSLDDALRNAGLTTQDDLRNPRLIGPLAEAQAAEAMIEQARLRPLPEASLEVENFGGSGDLRGFRGSEYTLSLSQQLELGGKRSARIRSATAEAGVARLRERLSRAQLGLAVRERYVSAVAREAEVELAANIVERKRELARIAGVLVDVGREPPLRAMRAEADLAEAEADWKAATAASLSARMALTSLWQGSASDTVPATFPPIAAPYELVEEYDGLPTAIAAAQSEAALAEVERERSLARLDPTVSAGLRHSAETDSQAIVVGVSVPLPVSNPNRGNIAAARARSNAARAATEVAEADFRQDVVKARAEYVAAQAKTETLEAESLPRAEEALRLVRIGYRNGKFPLIEVLSAGEARDDIRRALIEAKEARGKAAAQLIYLAAQ